MKRTFLPFQEEAGNEGSDGGSGKTATAPNPNDDGGMKTATPPNPNEDERIQAKYQAEKDARIKAEREYANFRKQFETIDPEKYRELVRQNEERENIERKKRGEFEKLETELRGHLGERDTEIQRLKQQLEDQDLNFKLGDAFTSSDARGKSEYKSDFISKAREYLSKDDAGEWRIENPNGGRLFLDDAGKEPVENFSQLAVYLREKTPYGVYYSPIQGKGSGSSGSPNPLESRGSEDYFGMEIL